MFLETLNLLISLFVIKYLNKVKSKIIMSDKLSRIINGTDTEISRFKEETLDLLNEQTNKMRSLNA
jgi:hypothetical protein